MNIKIFLISLIHTLNACREGICITVMFKWSVLSYLFQVLRESIHQRGEKSTRGEMRQIPAETVLPTVLTRFKWNGFACSCELHFDCICFD